MAYSFRFEVRIGHRDRTFRVAGAAWPPLPPVTSGPPDRWRPAEGGELEDLQVFLVRGARERRLPDALAGRLDLTEPVSDALWGAAWPTAC